jgi:putative ABC transport system substrate-binding protein
MMIIKQLIYLKKSFLLISLLWLLVACRPTEPKVITIGVVNLTPELDPVFEGFKEGMTALGYLEGEKVSYIYEGAVGGVEQLEPVVEKLIAAEVDLILAMSTPATEAVQQLTEGTEIPIVFVPVTDPVGAGVVKSLIEPGGNITGVTNGGSESRRLEWLLTITPNAKHFYLLHNPTDSSSVSALASAKQAASQLNVELLVREVESRTEVALALAEMPEEIDALFMLPSSVLLSNADQFIGASLERQLPLSVPVDGLVEAGGLISFSIRLSEVGKQAARLADKILQGIPPADLPVETAEFFLTLNLQTAQAIRLDIPETILQQADTLIR